jgi:hypothetical protein
LTVGQQLGTSPPLTKLNGLVVLLIICPIAELQNACLQAAVCCGDGHKNDQILLDATGVVAAGAAPTAGVAAAGAT